MRWATDQGKSVSCFLEGRPDRRCWGPPGFCRRYSVGGESRSGIFQATAKAIKPDYTWLLRCLILAPVFAAVSSLIPTVAAITADPAVALRPE